MDPAILDKLNAVQTKGDLLHFISVLICNFKEEPDEWENVRLDHYLESLAAWAEDVENYYNFNVRNENDLRNIPEKPNWKTIGILLMAGAFYE